MKQYKCIKQIDETECGVACLATICSYYGQNKDIATLRNMIHVDRYGSNMLDLYNAATKLGYKSEGLTGDLKELISSNVVFPCIAHVIVDNTLEHFVVIFKIDQNGAIIGDPAKGIVQYTLEDFSKVWTGQVLTMVPTGKIQKGKKISHPLIPFFKYVLSMKRQIMIIILLSLITTLIEVFSSFFSFYLIDVVIPASLINKLALAAIIIIIMYLFTLLLNIIRIHLTADVSKSLSQKLSRNYIEQLLKINYEFYDNYTTGDLISRLQDTDIVRDAVSKITVTSLLDVFVATISLTVLGRLDLRLFFVSLCFILIYVAVIAKFNGPISRITSDLRERDAKTTSYFLETVQGIETIKAYQDEVDVLTNNECNIAQLMETFKKATTLFSSQSTLAETIMLIGEISVLAIGGALIIEGTMSLGILIVFYSLFNMCLSPVKNIVDLLPIVRKAEISARRLQTVFSVPVEKHQRSDIDISLNDCIKIKNLSFRYGNRELVLNNLSLIINKGERIGLSGNSGTGKSTLAKLLLRFYTAESGKIEIGNRNINDIPLQIIRRKIAYVSQNAFLFRGSILKNIKIGNPDMSEADIVNFLNETPFKQFIEQFPMKYQSILTENGDNLSGGQRQMISLARALIKQAEILILDEATSAIDAQTEQLIEKSIQQIYPNTTTIVIAHRRRALQQCDRIATISNGEIVQIETWNNFHSL